MLSYFRNILFPVFRKIKSFFILLQRIKKIFKHYILPEKEREYQETENCYEKFSKDEMLKCYNHFRPSFLNSVFVDANKLNSYSLKKALENHATQSNNFFVEFGVFRGLSINAFAKILKHKKIYGFDSFEGLREDWAGTGVVKGEFDLKGKIPKLENNVIPVRGWVQNTVEPFLQEHKPLISFAHMDLDTYESTLFVLQKIKPHLTKGSILLFDELYNFPGWSVGEYKALTESFNTKEYKIIAFAKDGWSVAIEII